MQFSYKLLDVYERYEMNLKSLSKGRYLGNRRNQERIGSSIWMVGDGVVWGKVW